MPAISRVYYKLRLLYSLDTLDEVIGRIAWAPNGRDIALPTRSGAIHIWDTVTQQQSQCLSDYTETSYDVAWSPDGSLLAAACSDGAVRLWESGSNKVKSILLGHNNEVRSVAWSKDGRVLASGATDATVRLWSPTTNEPLGVLRGGSHFINCIRWSQDDSKLAAADGGGVIQLWDINTTHLHQLKGHESFVVSVAWSPRGDHIASASYDRTIRIWDIASGLKLRSLQGHQKAVTSIAFNLNGSYLASKSLDGTVRLWDCRSWELLEVIDESTSDHWAPGLAYHPKEPLLATHEPNNMGIRVWGPSNYRLGSRKLRAFLCHSSSDKIIVWELYKRLRNDGIQPWFDEESLLPGQNWRYEIEKAVAESDAILVCLSRSSLTKEGFVQKEIGYALELAEEKPEGTIFIIPVRLEECEVPRRLQRWQWVDFFTREGYDLLLKGLKARANSLGLSMH